MIILYLKCCNVLEILIAGKSTFLGQSRTALSDENELKFTLLRAYISHYVGLEGRASDVLPCTLSFRRCRPGNALGTIHK